MKNFSRIISVLLSLLMLCAIPFPASASEEPVILQQPQTPIYGEFSTAIYSVTVQGTNLRCTWYMIYNGVTYDISDTSVGIQPWEGYAGETYGGYSVDNGDSTTFNYHFGGIGIELDGSYIYAVIELTSSTSIIRVTESAGTPPSIRVPVSVEACKGDVVELECIASTPGSEPLSYIWYETSTGKLEDIVAIGRGSETEPTLRCDTGSYGTRYYVCGVDSPSGSAYSSVIPVTVYESQMTGEAPVFKSQTLTPAKEGQAYSFQIECSDENAEFLVYYNPGQRNEFDKTGLTLSAGGLISGTPTAEGSYVFTVMASNDYGEAYQIYTLTVQAPDEISLELIEEPNKTSYMIGDTIDLTGLHVRICVNDEYFDSYNGEGLTTTASVLNTAGERRIKISYGDAFTFFYVIVEAPVETMIEVFEAPDKTEYQLGDTLDLTGLHVRVYENGSYFDSYNGEGLTTTASVLNTIGERRIKISYGDAFTFFYITVAERVAVKGDVDESGSVSIADVAAVLDMIADKREPTAAADVNGDDSVTIADVAAILDIIAGKG